MVTEIAHSARFPIASVRGLVAGYSMLEVRHLDANAASAPASGTKRSEGSS